MGVKGSVKTSSWCLIQFCSTQHNSSWGPTRLIYRSDGDLEFGKLWNAYYTYSSWSIGATGFYSSLLIPRFLNWQIYSSLRWWTQPL